MEGEIIPSNNILTFEITYCNVINFFADVL